MDDYKEFFKRELDKLSYLYVKANTLSKKRRISYDLIGFENMYSYFLEDEDNIFFPWDNDNDLVKFRLEIIYKLVDGIMEDKFFLFNLFQNSFEIFTNSNFSIYEDYGKKYSRINEEMLQKYLYNFYNSIDISLGKRFFEKLKMGEIFVNNCLDDSFGACFPIGSLKKNFVLFSEIEGETINIGRIVAHEMGHDFEFANAYENGITDVWDRVSQTIYVEVSSCFFEYAFINYLIDTGKYRDDALIMKSKYLCSLYDYMKDILMFLSHDKVYIDSEFNLVLNNEDVVDFGNDLLEEMNSYDELYKLNDKLNFRNAFLYGIGRLIGIYVYDSYKRDRVNFLNNLKKSLLEYKYIGIDAFKYIGISSDDLIIGDVLKRTLNNK